MWFSTPFDFVLSSCQHVNKLSLDKLAYHSPQEGTEGNTGTHILPQVPFLTMLSLYWTLLSIKAGITRDWISKEEISYKVYFFHEATFLPRITCILCIEHQGKALETEFVNWNSWSILFVAKYLAELNLHEIDAFQQEIYVDKTRMVGVVLGEKDLRSDVKAKKARDRLMVGI